MIVIDSSALVAILRREPEVDRFLQVIAAADRCLLSAVSLLETSMVLAGRTGDGTAWTGLDLLMARAGIEVAAQDAEQARLAREAFLRFGKGRHPAALNLGDCASYALARSRALPLLFKGEDFTQTDLYQPPDAWCPAASRMRHGQPSMPSLPASLLSRFRAYARTRLTLSHESSC